MEHEHEVREASSSPPVRVQAALPLMDVSIQMINDLVITRIKHVTVVGV